MPQLIAAQSHRQPQEPDTKTAASSGQEAQETSGTCRSMANGKKVVFQLQHVGVGSIFRWKRLKVTCKESLETEQSAARGCPAPPRAGQAAEEVAWGCPGLSLPASLPQVFQ